MVHVFGRDKTKDLKRKGVFPYEWFDDIKNWSKLIFQITSVLEAP